MSDPKLRLTRKVREIKAALKSVPLQSELTLWIHPDEKRILFSGIFLKFDEALNQVILQLKIVPAALANQDFVFVKFSGNSGVGKCSVLNLKDNLLTLQVYEEMILAEMRSHRRIHFSGQDQKFVTLSVLGQPLQLNVVNASRSGLRVETNAEAAARICTSPSLKLIRLGEDKADLECDYVRHDETSLALRFKNEIPESTFLQFIRTPAFDRVDPEKFFQDQDYLDTVKSNMEETIERLEKLPKLSTAMKTLKVDRSGNYMRTHIDLLCYVSCSLGRILGWVTRKTLDKLILAAYLHDIRYFENPKLARISTLKDFESQKDALTPEEQKIYLEGPLYSALMSRDSGESSIDVERMLMQQKERPDGSGFPEGVDFKQLFPLSCLFMVCHEFVDYLYVTPQWSFRDFTTKARSIYKGPYFIKILEAFDDLS